MTKQSEIQALMNKESYRFEDLVAIVSLLRAENGCPWDREQDHHSIRKCLIEETYEVVEAIDNEDPMLLREELGDLLFQILFHAQMEKEEHRFCVDDVIDDITKKMIHRHPHVFGTVKVENSEQVLQNWESIKTEEKQRNTLLEKLRAIPPMMPALMRASKVGKKAGTEMDTSPRDLLDKLESQIAELRLTMNTSADFDPRAAVGAILMRVTELSRAWDVDAEQALFEETERLIEKISSNSL